MRDDAWPRTSWGRRAVGVATVIALLALLETFVRMGMVNARLVPAPSTVAERTATLLTSGAVLAPLGTTLGLLFVAFSVASALAVATGLAMGRWAAVHDLLEPLVELVRPLPKPALLPPAILFLGLGDAMKLTIVGLGVFFPVLVNTVQGVRGVDRVLIDTARTLGRSKATILLKVVLPAALPLVLTGMRIALAIGLILVTLAEMLAGTGGLGWWIVDMQRSFRVQQMYAWLVVLAVVGYVLNAAFLRLERRLTRWVSAGAD